MEHRATELKERTKCFVLRVIRVTRALPPGAESRMIASQLFRSATSAAANYRAVCRARSRRDFLAKLSIVIEETDESAFWLELLVDANFMPAAKLKELRSEATQLVAILNASRTTAKKGLHSTIKNQQSSTGAQ